MNTRRLSLEEIDASFCLVVMINEVLGGLQVTFEKKTNSSGMFCGDIQFPKGSWYRYYAGGVEIW
jgi:hypothetical protein